jgi:ADP-ribose pyrophosphatase YjhB (NUDIX family)
MRRSRRIRAEDLPRLALRAVVEVAALFGGRYRRIEGAHLIVTDDEGRILVVRTTYLGKEWMLPGGRVERAERPHDAAVRETREETGIEAVIERLVAVDASDRDGVSFIYAARRSGGDLDPQLGEIAETGWVARSEIAASDSRLHRLLSAIEAGGTPTGVAYLTGLGTRRA